MQPMLPVDGGDLAFARVVEELVQMIVDDARVVHGGDDGPASAQQVAELVPGAHQQLATTRGQNAVTISDCTGRIQWNGLHTARVPSSGT